MAAATRPSPTTGPTRPAPATCEPPQVEALPSPDQVEDVVPAAAGDSSSPDPDEPEPEDEPVPGDVPDEVLPDVLPVEAALLAPVVSSAGLVSAGPSPVAVVEAAVHGLWGAVLTISGLGVQPEVASVQVVSSPLSLCLV